MSTRRLRQFEAELVELRDRARELGDERGAERIGRLVEHVRDLTALADAVLSRIGNPPTEP